MVLRLGRPRAGALGEDGCSSSLTSSTGLASRGGVVTNPRGEVLRGGVVTKPLGEVLS